MEDVTSDLCLCPGIFVGDLVTECKEALTEILTDPLTVFYYIYYIYYINTKDWLNKRSGLRPNIALDSMNPFASRRFGQFPAGSNHVRSRNMFLLLLTGGDLAKGEQFMEKEEFAEMQPSAEWLNIVMENFECSLFLSSVLVIEICFSIRRWMRLLLWMMKSIPIRKKFWKLFIIHDSSLETQTLVSLGIANESG